MRNHLKIVAIIEPIRLLQTNAQIPKSIYAKYIPEIPLIIVLGNVIRKLGHRKGFCD